MLRTSGKRLCHFCRQRGLPSAKQNGFSKPTDDAMPVDLEPSPENSDENERQKERDKEILSYAKDTGTAS